MPSRSAIAATSFAVWFPSQGGARSSRGSRAATAMSSSAICDGPSSPIETPACEPAETERRARDGRHADEVVRARVERRERRGEGAPAARLQPDRGRRHLLLGDVHLEEAVGVRLLEDLGEGRVRDLAVDRDDVAARRPSAASASPYALRVATSGRPRTAAARAAPVSNTCASPRLGLRDVDRDVAQPAELLDRRLGVVERLAVPAVLVLDRLHALALDRARDDRPSGWPVVAAASAYAASIASTSWPSISIACQPNASARAR